jgi:hypothetical protein
MDEEEINHSEQEEEVEEQAEEQPDDDDDDVDENTVEEEKDLSHEDVSEIVENDDDDIVILNEEDNDNRGYQADEEAEGMISDDMFSKVLTELITLKCHTDSKKKQSQVIPSAKKFLVMSMSRRSKNLTKNVRKNLLHLCDFVWRGKLPIDTSSDNRRYLKHLIDKRTPQADVEVGLTEDLRTHAILCEVIDLIEGNGGTGKTITTR